MLKPNGNNDRRRPSRLRRRLILPLGMLTALLCALMGWVAHDQVRRALDDQLRATLEGRVDAVDASVERLRRAVETQLVDLVESRQRDDPDGITRVLGGGAGAAEQARRWMARGSLQWLVVLDEQGSVLSSATWPEQVGLRRAELLALPAGRAVLRRLATATATATPLAFVTRHEMHVGSRRLHVLGGFLLDEAGVLRAGGGSSWVQLVDDDPELGPEPQNGRRAGVATLGRPPAAGLRGSVDGPPRTLERDDLGQRWLVAREPLLPDEPDRDGPRASLFTAVSAAGNDRVLSRLARTLGAVVLLAGFLAAGCGAWIARRVTAPVAELVRSVDAIAAGTEDYSFTRATEDEFEELAASFSRLYRSLELQRQRSRAAERVAAWRDVARRVAHEVKNPLAPIRLTVENLMRARKRPDSRVFDEMFDDGTATILDEVDRLKRLVSEFSEFARLPLPQPRPTELGPLIDEVLTLHRAEPGLEIQREGQPVLPTLALDPDQIARALQNVIGNAVEAMRDNPQERPRLLRVRTSVDEGFLRLDVEDSGPGLSPEALDQLFEPYFTSKSEGTGLGLSITYRIVTEHGGLIDAANHADGGARVTLRLPLEDRGRIGEEPAP